MTEWHTVRLNWSICWIDMWMFLFVWNFIGFFGMKIEPIHILQKLIEKKNQFDTGIVVGWIHVHCVRYIGCLISWDCSFNCFKPFMGHNAIRISSWRLYICSCFCLFRFALHAFRSLLSGTSHLFQYLVSCMMWASSARAHTHKYSHTHTLYCIPVHNSVRCERMLWPMRMITTFPVNDVYVRKKEKSYIAFTSPRCGFFKN